jgi:hypothetical protein
MAVESLVSHVERGAHTAFDTRRRADSQQLSLWRTASAKPHVFARHHGEDVSSVRERTLETFCLTAAGAIAWSATTGALTRARRYD